MLSLRIWIPLEFTLKYEYAFPWDQAHLAQARLLLPASMPHLQRLQTSRMFWDRMWKRITSLLTAFLRTFYFPDSKCQKHFSYI